MNLEGVPSGEIASELLNVDERDRGALLAEIPDVLRAQVERDLATIQRNRTVRPY
jgi:hypothetical protein